MAKGEGSGDGEEGMVMGATVSVALAIIMCICGIPMIIIGIVFIAIGNGWFMTVGIVFIVSSVLMLIAAVILTVYLCTRPPSNNNTTQPNQTIVVLGSNLSSQPVQHVQGEAFPASQVQYATIEAAQPLNGGTFVQASAPIIEAAQSLNGGTVAQPQPTLPDPPPPSYEDTFHVEQDGSNALAHSQTSAAQNAKNTVIDNDKF